MVYLLQWKLLKDDEKCFLFYLRSSFCCQDIWIFVLTFWPFRKNGFIRKIKLIWKFMTYHPGYQTITMHILSSISRRKGNQTMKSGQVTEYDKIIFLQKSCLKWGSETSSRSRFVFSKLYIRQKQLVCGLVSIYFNIPELRIQ